MLADEVDQVLLGGATLLFLHDKRSREFAGAFISHADYGHVSYGFVSAQKILQL